MNTNYDSPAPAPARMLSSRTVGQMLGFRSRASFWQFVWRESVPCIRLTSRHIVFPQQALNDWLAARSNTGGVK
jgi:predicted DNA-binding transcriptional regulator AlpA